MEDRDAALDAWEEEVEAVDQTVGGLLAKEKYAEDPFEDSVIREERGVAHPLIVETIEIIERDLRDVSASEELSVRLVDELRERAQASSTLERIRRFK